MAAVMRNFRCERFYLFLRLFNESGISLPQRFALRSTFSTNTCKLYSKTLPFMAKKWEAAGTTDHDFARPRTSGRDDLKTRSRSNNRNYSNEEDDSESDSESEDEEDVSRKSGKLKVAAKLSQKSVHTKVLRPSKYLFRDRGGWNEEKQWEGREIPEDSKGKAGWYAKQMSRLTNEGKIDEAQELFSSIKEEKVALTVEIFNVIISSYAKKGKVREAFKLYNDIKKRSLQPTPHTYTSLFNACTKSLSPQRALENVEKLLTEINMRIAKDDLEMNVITYNAAIQAVTVCGDPFRAFELYKEMKHNNVKPDGHTFSSLLTACSFDKIEGPSIAMEMLEEMKSLKIKPDIYIFNCILKIMRDFKVFLQGQKPELPGKPVLSSENELTQATEAKSGKSDPKHVEVDQNTREQNKEGLKLHSYFPGAEKFIQMMAIEDVYPDVRTFQLLLYLTSSKAEEEFLMELMKSCNISPDVPFFNTLVKRNALEGDLQKAKEHMKKLEETFQVSPSEKSYQTLARGCRGPKEGLALLDEIQSVGITSAQSVYGTLIAGAAKQRQFTYLVKLVKRMTSEGVEPNERIMTVLERTYSLPCKKPYMKENTHHRLVKEKRFRYVEQKGFQSFFENWKEKAFRKKKASKNDDDDDDDITDEEDSKFNHL